jgi:hypothetical protein
MMAPARQVRPAGTMPGPGGSTPPSDRDAGIRQLQVMKANYGPEGEKVRMRWERGVFLPESMVSPPAGWKAGLGLGGPPATSGKK